MASVAQDQKRPSIVGTLLMLALVIVVGFIAFQFVTSIVMWFIRTALMLLALYLIFKVGMYLLRKGR